MIPNNYYRYFSNQHIHILQQSWSLGLEVMFYAIFPFILIWRWRTQVALVSFAIYLIAFFGVIDTDLYGFRYLPGVLFMFICGSWLYESDGGIERAMPWLFWAASVVLLIIAFLQPGLWQPNRDVLLGLIVGIPAIYALKRLSVASGAFDATAGNLSYGIFLNHMIVLSVVAAFTGIVTNSVAGVATICAVATVLSYISFKIVEEPVLKRRHAMRSKARDLGVAPKFPSRVVVRS